MGTERTDAEIRSIVENAFRPLRCVAEIWDYDQKLRFRVFGANQESVVTCENLVLRTLHDDNTLSSIVGMARRVVEEKGFTLTPWALK